VYETERDDVLYSFIDFYKKLIILRKFRRGVSLAISKSRI